MDTPTSPPRPTVRTWLGLAAAVVLPVLVVLMDDQRGRRLFDEGPPELGAVAVVRSSLLILGVVGLLVASRSPSPRPGIGRWSPRGEMGIVAVTALVLLTTVLFVVSPTMFTRLGREDGAIENLTALGFLVGGGLAATAGIRTRGCRSQKAERGQQRADAQTIPGTRTRGCRSQGARLVVLGYGAAMLLAGLEEISYGQRLLGFEGPEALVANNLQGEANLHNIATDATEAIFYAAMALVLLLLPYLAEHTAWRHRLGPVTALAPPTWLAVAAVPVLALNHDMWDVVPVQLTVWTALGVLVVVADRVRGRRRALVVTVLVLAVGVQAVALTHDRFVLLYDITEFKEALLGLLVLLHGASLFASAPPRLPRT